MKGSLSDAFGEIYTAYAEKIYRYIFQLCHDPVIAEDILQTTFLKAIENADRFQGKCSVDTWLCRIAKNTWLDECGRAEAKNVSIDAFTEENGDAILSSAQSDPGILHQLIQDEERRRIYRLIDELEEPYREIVRLRIFAELSFDEIGNMYGKTAVWARVSYYRAKVKLVREMEGL